jgi:hypothetical protein
MWFFVLTATGSVTQQAQQGDLLTQILSGIAAIGGVVGALGGVLSAVYVTKFNRRRQERDFLSGKLEKLYSQLGEEFFQTTRAIETIFRGAKDLKTVDQIFSENAAVFSPIWATSNDIEILIRLYFRELGVSFDSFRAHRVDIGILLKRILTANDLLVATDTLLNHVKEMGDDYDLLRLGMNEIADKICPRK